MKAGECQDLKEAYSELLQRYYRADMTIIMEVMWGPDADKAEKDIFKKVDGLSRKYLNRPFREER